MRESRKWKNRFPERELSQSRERNFQVDGQAKSQGNHQAINLEVQWFRLRLEDKRLQAKVKMNGNIFGLFEKVFRDYLRMTF